MPRETTRSGSGPARDPGAHDVRRDAIVGHRLAGGYMSVHAPGQPCGLCEGAPAITASLVARVK
jgi:hypothetical protein